jgi:hypothetical protein
MSLPTGERIGRFGPNPFDGGKSDAKYELEGDPKDIPNGSTHVANDVVNLLVLAKPPAQRPSESSPMRTDTSLRTSESTHVVVSVTVALIVAILLGMIAN